ncbi:MAG: hypothetical protein WC967_14800 [Balneolaceae bacterium]
MRTINEVKLKLQETDSAYQLQLLKINTAYPNYKELDENPHLRTKEFVKLANHRDKLKVRLKTLTWMLGE